MRMTQSMLSNKFMYNLGNSFSSMDVYQQQLSTGKKVTRPSQDPVVATNSMRYRTEVRNIEQYERNFGGARTWLENSDTALGETMKSLQRIRELNIEAATDTNTDAERASISAEVKQLISHIESVANTQVAGKFIFNGLKNDTQPIDIANDKLDPDDGQLYQLELDKNILVPVNVNAQGIFNSALFNSLQKLATDLDNSDQPELEEDLGAMDDLIQTVLTARSEVGARSNRLDMMNSRIMEQEEIATKVMSDNEDAEIDVVITNLKTQEAVHRAALSVGGRIIQPSLVDFMR